MNIKTNTMTEAELKGKLENISRDVTRAYGDHGSCVLGYELLLDGEAVVSQPAQGSSTCGFVYAILQGIMRANGIDDSRVTTNYGVMD
jgi:rhamnogalacturonyl hydrolase YesR